MSVEKKHVFATCRDCAELWRLAEVVQVLGYRKLSEDIVDQPCEASGGLAIADIIEAVISELADGHPDQAALDPVKEPEKEPEKEFGPGGPPPFKQENREFHVSKEELDTAMKVIQATEDPGFMLKAARQAHTFIIERLESLNKKAGFNEDGSVKTAEEKEVEAYKPPRKSYPGRSPGKDTRPPDITLEGYRLFSVRHQKRLINQAKLAADAQERYVIRHFFISPNGPTCHQYVGKRGDDCCLCGGKPSRAVLFPIQSVNKHGKPARDAVIYREEWL